MANQNLFEKYGIKEVADVMFYDINNDGTPGAPVLYLDTLKVSTIQVIVIMRKRKTIGKRKMQASFQNFVGIKKIQVQEFLI